MSGRFELATGVATLAVIALAVTLGATLWPLSPTETLDPPHGALLPPGRSMPTLLLRDGRRLASPSIESIEGAVRLTSPHGVRTIALDRIRLESSPERHFVLGSDRFGRDVAARVLHGGRLSLLVAAAVVTVTLLVGVPFGLAAGLARGRADALAVALLDSASAFPRLFLVIALAALVSPSIWAPIAILGATGWMPLARLVRAEVLRLASADFVLAARAAGASEARIALRHLLPNVAGAVGVEASLGVASAVAAESALSFLGLGLPPPAPTWGGLIAEGRDLLREAPWVALAPAVALALTVLGATMVAEGLRARAERTRAIASAPLPRSLDGAAESPLAR